MFKEYLSKCINASGIIWVLVKFVCIYVYKINYLILFISNIDNCNIGYISCYLENLNFLSID